MTVRVGVIDYGRGNLKSIMKALEHVGARPRLLDSLVATHSSELLVLPGVGAFAEGMRGLHERGLDEGIRRFVESGGVVLGICLGCQMLMTTSDEFGGGDGLDLIRGRVVGLPASSEAIPNVGWKRLINVSDDQAHLHFPSIREGEWAYFVHSFHCTPTDTANVLASVRHGGNLVTAVIGKDNVFGFQFHPEKSGTNGLEMLRDVLRFIK